MTWDGAGNFNRVYDWTADLAAGAPRHFITASRMDTEMDGFATGLENCLNRNGENAMTATLTMAGNKIDFDTDADTSISAANDDVMVFEVAGSNGAFLGHGTGNTAGFLHLDPGAITVTAATDFGILRIGNTNAITVPAGTTAIAAGLYVEIPNWTATGTITASATVYIAGAASEGGTDYALWVDAGATHLDGTLAVGSTTSMTGKLTILTTSGIEVTTGNVTTGGKFVIDVDGTAIDGAGTIVLGAGADAGIMFNGTDLELDTATGAIRFSLAGTALAYIDGDGLSLAAGDAYQINDTSVLNATTLGSAVVASSLTSVGTLTSLTSSGDITGAGIHATGDTAANDNAAMGYTATAGLILTGQGSSTDFVVRNDAGTDVITISTGTTAVDIVGDLTALTLNADGATSDGDNAAIGYSSTNGIEIRGQGSTNDIILLGDLGSQALRVPSGTANLIGAGSWTLAGILTVQSASESSFAGAISIDNTTDSTSGTPGSLHTDGGIGITKDLYVGSQIGIGVAPSTFSNTLLAMSYAGSDTGIYIRTTGGAYSAGVTLDSGGGSPATFVRGMGSGTEHWRIGSQSVANRFQIHIGSGTTKVLDFFENGVMNLPLLPAFSAYNSVTDGALTGDGTVVTADFDTETLDQGGDFASDIFTAPADGFYHFSASLFATGLTAAADNYFMYIVTSNETYRNIESETNDIEASSHPLSVTAWLDSGDTCRINLYVSGEAGKVVGIQGSGVGSLDTFFSGFQVA